MRNISIKGKNIPIDSRGETLLIYLDEFKKDILKDAVSFLKEPFGDLTRTTRLAYALIKTANSSSYKDYRTFMNSFKSFEDFIQNSDNVSAIITELLDICGFSTEKEEEKKSDSSKKKAIIR